METPRFNLAIITIQPRRRGPPSHRHTAEDDAFSMLEGDLVFTADDEEVVAGPGTFAFENRTDAVARFVNVHAPAGFDIRLEED